MRCVAAVNTRDLNWKEPSYLLMEVEDALFPNLRGARLAQPGVARVTYKPFHNSDLRCT